MKDQEFLPICSRFASYNDTLENAVYSSNGNFLEKFEKNDNTLVYKESFKVLESGITIDKICKHAKGLIVTGDHRIAIFCIIEKKVLARGKHFDHIIAVKSLKDGTIAILSARKKLHILKLLEDGSFADVKSLELNQECTIFTGIIRGGSVNELEVFAGGILGSIHRHKPFEGADVLTSYEGHEGMIFEMDIFGNKLYSIGDDRSIRIFDIESAKELNVAYGHESRIRALKVLSDDRIFSAGDEICLWKWIGSSLKLIEKYEVGIGKIVHLNIFDNLLLASSMNGAMVTVQIKEKFWEPIKIPAFEDYVIRAFIKILDGTYFFVDDQKHLYFTTKDTVIKRFIENQKIRFDSLRLSKSGKYAAAASDNKVFLIETSTKKYCTFVVEDVLGGEFFVDDELIVIAKNGKGIAFSMKDNVFIKKPACVSRGLPIKCGLAVDNFYLFGTTKGYIIAYEKSDLLKEAFSFKVSPKSEPVTDISVINSQIYILTRDGKCSVCQKQNDKYEIIDSYTTAEKPTAFLSFENEHYIWGFRASEFIFTPLRSTNPLAVYECGGGHRISNVYPIFDEKKNFYGIRYEHIIRGEFKIVEMEISKIQNVVGPFHQSNIYGITMINEGHSIITAGIDTKILLCNIDTNGRFCPRWHSSAHLSSIHSLDSTKLRNGTEFVATCGGTSEIRIWKIGENSLFQCGNFTCKPDYRYVSIKIRQSLEDENILYIFAACSIRQIHIFSFNISIGKIEKLLSYQNSEPSTFSKIAVSSDLLTIYAASTSGTVTALSWSPGSKEPSLIQKVEAFDSGLSAICSINLNDTNLSKNVCAVGCEGGDFSLVDFETESVVLKSSHPHYSTITDICFSSYENHWTLGTIATDCQIIISYFGITSDGNLEIVNTKYFNTNVGDPIAISPIDNSSNYLIVGQGIDFV